MSGQKLENENNPRYSKEYLLGNPSFPKEDLKKIEDKKARKLAEKIFQEQQRELLDRAVEALKNVPIPVIPNARFPIQEAIVVEWLNGLSHKKEFEMLFMYHASHRSIGYAWRELASHWEKDKEGNHGKLCDLLGFVIGSYPEPASNWQQFDKNGERGW